MPQSTGRLSGRWNEIGKILTLAPFRIETNAETQMRECGEIYLQAVDEVVAQGGNPPWKPLSRKWVRQKGHAGFYTYQGEFMSKLSLRRVRVRKDHFRIFAGASPYKRHEGSGLRLDYLADVLQDNFSRPLFGPAWERAKHEIAEKLAAIGDIF